MNMVSVFGVVSVGLISSLLIKYVRPDYSVMICLAAALAVIVLILPPVRELILFTDMLAELSLFDDGMIGVMMKAVGTAYLAGFVSEMCESAGEAGLSSKIELGEKIYIMTLCLPVIGQILDAIRQVSGA